MDNYRSNEQNRTDVAHIGKSVVVKGELSGSEDLFLDGEIEGSIALSGHNVTVGPNGKVKANINAKQVIIEGKVDGNVTGTDRVELRSSAVLVGDVFTQRIMIEDGAYFKGSIEIDKSSEKESSRSAFAKPATANAGAPAAKTI